MQENLESNLEEILNLIPQRPPFLFVDRILEREGARIKTAKYLSGEEDFFKGHFPGMPIMPGVLLQEALFQTGALLMAQTGEKGLGVVTAVSKGRFRQLVRPGDEIQMEVWLEEKLANAYYFKGSVTQNNKRVLDLNFTCAVVNRDS